MNIYQQLKFSWDITHSANDKQAERIRAWNALYTRGEATTHEMMQADFGTLEPKGLDIDPIPERTIHFKTIFESESFRETPHIHKIKALRWGGWVQSDNDTEIYVNPLYYSPYIMPFRNTERFFKTHKALSHADIEPHESIHIHQHYVDKSGLVPQNKDNDIEHEGYRNLNSVQKTLRKARRLYKTFQSINGFKGITPSGYYAQNVEMQARMHEIIALAYTEWQQLPTSRIELFAALESMGIHVPDTIKTELNETEDGQKARRLFHLSQGLKDFLTSTVGTFNKVQDYMGDENVIDQMWHKKYPQLYGGLLEFYGDRLGRERMGMGKNPRIVIETLHAFKQTPFLKPPEIQNRAETLPVELSAVILNAMTASFGQGEKGHMHAMRYAKELLKRDDVKSRLFRDGLPVRTYAEFSENAPLFDAISHNNTDMIRVLLEAGSDPFQYVTQEGFIDENSYNASIGNFFYPLKNGGTDDYCNGIRSSLQAVADYAPDLDREDHVFIPPLGFQKRSLRSMLAEYDITPRAQQSVYEPTCNV